MTQACGAGTWWGYIDARDVAASCRVALDADIGAEHFIVAAADTVMNRPSRELMAEMFPSVPYNPTAVDFDTLLSIQKARTARIRASLVVARPPRRQVSLRRP